MIFLNGNSDLVTRILEFVAESSEELNTCAMISQVFRLSRDDSRFDQTRTGTIILKTSPENIPSEVWQRWDQQVFTGNRVRLVAILTQLPSYFSYPPKSPPALTSVRELILHRHSSVKVLECEHGGELAVRFFKKILPNLDILDIGALAGNTSNPLCLNTPDGVLHDLRISVFRCTAEVSYRGCHFRLLQPCLFPVDNSSTMNSLREIHIDPFGVYFHGTSPPIAAYCQEYSQNEQEEWFRWFRRFSRDNNGVDWVLLQEYPNLERVTLKHADYYTFDDRSWKVLPQEVLMKFARHTPKLRWFCSDLTEENIASLKEERPEVEFCN
jgi:hypothetical protein